MHIRKYLYSALECPFDSPWLLLSLHINCPWEPKTGTEDGFEEMEHEFLFGTFRPEKQDHLFRSSVARGNFLPEQLKNVCSIYFSTGFSRNFV